LPKEQLQKSIKNQKILCKRNIIFSPFFFFITQTPIIQSIFCSSFFFFFLFFLHIFLIIFGPTRRSLNGKGFPFQKPKLFEKEIHRKKKSIKQINKQNKNNYSGIKTRVGFFFLPFFHFFFSIIEKLFIIYF